MVCGDPFRLGCPEAGDADQRAEVVKADEVPMGLFKTTKNHSKSMAFDGFRMVFAWFLSLKRTEILWFESPKGPSPSGSWPTSRSAPLCPTATA